MGTTRVEEGTCRAEAVEYGMRNVSFSYGERVVLRDVTLLLPERGVVCFFGPSGCGKTTALHLLAGLLQPEAGQVTRPERIAAVFQEDRLLPWLNAVQNVCLLPDVREEEAQGLLERLGMEENRKAVAQMSGGQKRRVAVARALAARADLLLLDEPFRGLDAAARDAAVAAVRERAREIPCVLVTHDRAEAEMLEADVREFTAS